MTLEEAKAKLREANYEGEPTAALLRLVGWEPADPLAGVALTGPKLTADQVKDELAKLLQEAQSQNVPAQILSGIVRLGTIAALAAGV